MFDAMEVINSSKQVFGRATAMALSAATQGGAARKAVGSTFAGAWKANRSQILTHAAYGAGGAIGLGMGQAAFSGRGYSFQDAVRQGALGAAVGGGGSMLFHSTRSMGAFKTHQSFMRNGNAGMAGSMIERARRMGGF